jgi:hypothetical protein
MSIQSTQCPKGFGTTHRGPGCRSGVILFTFFFLISGCATTTATKVKEGCVFAPTTDVAVLPELPKDRPHVVIAILETAGSANMPLPELLDSMRQKGKELGADAVVALSGESTKSPVTLMYNPALGGYQTVGGYDMPKVRGVAIKYGHHPECN